MQLVRRHHLQTGRFDQQIDRIEAHRVTMAPAQVSGTHSHRGGVIGLIISGEAVLQLRGEPEHRLAAGSTFYEPPGVLVDRFDNASEEAELEFLAFYPLLGEMPLVEFSD